MVRYLRDDRGFMLAAANRSGMSLRFVNPELRANTDFMFTACGQDGLALEHGLASATARKIKKTHENQREQ